MILCVVDNGLLRIDRSDLAKLRFFVNLGIVDLRVIVGVVAADAVVVSFDVN